jgi:hypothetical protein
MVEILRSATISNLLRKGRTRERHPLPGSFGGLPMATNTGDGFRRGSVTDRSQTYNPRNDTFVKRDTTTGRFMDVKSDGTPFKGVAKEPDGRRR